MPSSARTGTAAAEGRAALARRARRVAAVVAATYPDARCALDHRGPFELLAATILAAQCTDERVNLVTPPLFARYPDAAAMARADIADLEALVRSTGFYRAKAKNLKGAAAGLAERFPDGFPSTMDELLTLPGVGRKTANVVLGTCFGLPAIIVDTHVRRVAGRLGLARSDDPDEIERELQALLPADSWTDFSHGLTFHGRRRCHARKPDCGPCPLARLCPSRVGRTGDPGRGSRAAG
jgi:endonuclease-3